MAWEYYATSDEVIQTYKCEGCGQRRPAPAPYGGHWHSACSTACLTHAMHAADARAKDPRLLVLIETDWGQQLLDTIWKKEAMS
jgi:hypothetical protein